MNKVTTINLNGKAYQLEEAGYEKLHSYLKDARHNLDGNPDQDEIVKDFEQAIAEKCDKYIKAHKNVVTEAEVETIINEMGPVQSDETTAEHAAAKEVAPKRLYRIREGAWIAGVCNGIAAYFGVDVTIVRVLFVIFALFTRGGGIGLYVLMAFFVPAAETNEERAFAHGKQFNAQEFMAEMKEKYGKYGDEKYWKKYQKKYKKYASEEYWNAHADTRRRYAMGVANGWISFTRVGTGIFTFLGSMALAGIAIAYSIVMWSIIVNGNVFHNEVLVGASPVLLGIFATACVYVIMAPLRALVNEARRHTWNIPNHKKNTTAKIFATIVWFIAIGFIVTIATLSVPRHDTGYKPYGVTFWLGKHHVCIGGNYYCNPQAATDAADLTAVKAQVTDLGDNLQMVSLLAPKADVKSQMDNVYSPYLTPELLKQWEAKPETALGREVSSPWPAHIDIDTATKNTDGTYTVTGDVIELTSNELEHGGIAGEYPVTLTLVKRDIWRISNVVKGMEKNLTSTPQP